MNITMKMLDENPDGSINAQVTYDNEALEYMVEYAIVGMLTEYANKVKEEKKNAKAKPRSKRNTKVS
jgi:hypothetical protein